MCAIFGSKDKQKFLELAELNQYRGNHSWSTTCFVTGRFEHYANAERVKHILTFRGEGEFKDKVTGFPEDNKDGFITYYLGHVQAPTTDSVETHPSNINGDLLWHNGIIKDNEVKRLQELYNSESNWDTELMLMHYAETKNFDDLDGTFACVLYDNEQLYLARNEISPLFYNDYGDISSTKFDGSVKVPPNKLLTFNFNDVNMDNVVAEFTTKENPYFFNNVLT